MSCILLVIFKIYMILFVFEEEDMRIIISLERDKVNIKI